MSSGNSLAGSEAMERVTVRVHADRLAEFDEAVDASEEWANRSEAMRDLMQQATGHGTPDWLPDDDQLANAYRALRRNCNPDSGKINVDVAKTAVAEATRVQKEAVRDRVFAALEDRGLIAPKWHKLYVRFPDE